MKPKSVTSDSDIVDLLPDYSEIPDEFKELQIMNGLNGKEFGFSRG